MAVEWMRLQIAGIEWRVDLCTTDEYPDLENRYGDADPDTCRIVIQSALARDKQRIVLIHEILHAMFTTPGEGTLIAKMLGIEEDAVDDAEELLVTHLAPKLADTLHRAKLLRVPRPPKQMTTEKPASTKRRAAKRAKRSRP